MRTVKEAAPLPVVHCLWRLHEGGAERSVALLAAHQKAASLDVRVVVGQSAESSLTRKLDLAKVPVHCLHMKRGADLRSARCNAAAIPRGPHIMHFHSTEFGILGALLGRHNRDRYVYTHRCGKSDYGPAHIPSRIMWGAALRICFQGFAAISTSAQDAMSRLFAIPKERIVIIHNALDPSDFALTRSKQEVMDELGLDPQRLVVGTSANIRKLKRIELLLKASSELGPDNYSFVIIGAGVDLSHYEKMAREMRLSNVNFIGHRSDIANYLQILDMFVMTSGKEEGFGNAAIEAMYLGIPTILFSDLASLSSICRLGDGINVVEDSRSLSRRIEYLRCNPEHREKLVLAGQRLVTTRFTPDRVVRDYAALYGEVCGKRLRQVEVGIHG